MPKAAMHKNYRISGGQHDIGLAGQILTPERKTKTQTMQKRTHPFFRDRIPAANPTHIPAATCGG
jgi:hypothetical protein